MIAQPARTHMACPSCGSTVAGDAAACATCGTELRRGHSELAIALHDVARLAGKAVGWAVLIGVLAMVTWMATHGGRPY